jgi:hypothetical protein
MAIKSLDDRLDELSAIEQDVEDMQVQTPSAPPPEPIEYTAEPQQFEDPTQVAGIGSVIKKIIKEAPKREVIPVVPAGQDAAKVGPYQVIPEAADPQAQKALDAAAIAPTTGKPSDLVEPTVFNLDQIQDADGVKQFIEATARVYGADKIEKISYKEVAEQAAKDGYDEAFVARIIDPTKVTQAKPEDAYKMLLAITDAGKRAYELGEKVKAAKIAGNLSPELASEFHQAVALEGVLLKAAKGRQADIARTLGIFSQARTSTVERGQMLEAIVNEAGGMENAYDLASKYTSLDTRSARTALSEKSISGTFKDVWFGTWINGLLSSPVTHAKNIFANMFFGALQIPERAVATAFGKVRNKLFGGEKAIELDETYAMAQGWLQGIREGASFGKTAFLKNEATDPFTKIESGRLGRDPFDFDFGDSETGKAMANMMRYWGNFVTIPGRALMAEDEFFKGIGYRMQLNALAVRSTKQEYDRLIAAGLTPDEAADKAQTFGANILSNPPADIDEAARDFSRVITFTNELESGLQGIQKTLQNPFLKMFVPFVRTPTNTALESITRTPGLNLVSPRFWSDFNAGGIRRDMAMSKVTLGSALIFGTGTYALEGKITGYGPMRREDKEALKGTGWQEFSFSLNKDDVDPELLKKFQEITSVTFGPDKVYISYAGLEPLSTLLSIAASAGEYSMMTAGEGEMDKLMMGGAMGIYHYLSEQPMLSGFADVTKMFTVPSKDAPTFLYNLLSRVTKQVTEVAIGGSPIGVHSSLVAAIERLVDPDRSNVMESISPDEIDPLGGAAKGFWEAVGYYKSRNPLTSNSLPPMLDTLTGDTKRAGKGNLYEMFNPFRKSDGTFAPAYGVLLEYEVPAYMPSRKIKGVELSAEQYNRMIELATDNGKLAEMVVKVGTDPQIVNLLAQDKAAAQEFVQSVITNAYSMAKDMLVAEDPSLALAIKDLEEEQKEYGKYKR